MFVFYNSFLNDHNGCTAASAGRAGAVNILCQWMRVAEDFNIANGKTHLAVHVAASAAVMQALYENGADLWSLDAKGRSPLFTSSYFGRVDCVAFLINIAINRELGQHTMINGIADSEPKLGPLNTNSVPACIKAGDKQGDTALHVACLCGHLQCAIVLLYYLRDSPNAHGLSCSALAMRNGHLQISSIVKSVELQRTGSPRRSQNLKDDVSSSFDIFGCSFNALVDSMLSHGSRWTKSYDATYDMCYYEDRATGNTQWDRPESYDEPAKAEENTDRARELLKVFYLKYNPSKITQMNEILAMYKNRYTELFITLCERYHIDDLSMFSGIDLE
jgi:hypothetical protein